MCQYCGTELYYADSGGRDTETMGGYEVEYLRCPACNILYSHISGELPTMLCEEGDI